MLISEEAFRTHHSYHRGKTSAQVDRTAQDHCRKISILTYLLYVLISIPSLRPQQWQGVGHRSGVGRSVYSLDILFARSLLMPKNWRHGVCLGARHIACFIIVHLICVKGSRCPRGGVNWANSKFSCNNQILRIAQLTPCA